MEELLQEILPDIPPRENFDPHQNAIVCANCCSSFDSSRNTTNGIIDTFRQHHSFSDSFPIIEVAKSCEIDDLYSTDVNKMLSEIYNLNFIPRLKQKYYPTSGEELINTEQVGFPLCGPCTSLLKNLFSLYSQFNQIRKIESLLSQQINELNSLIDYNQDQTQPSSHSNGASGGSTEASISIRDVFNPQEITATTTRNRNGISSKFEFPSNDRGPWVKVGPRLEDLTVEAIGYAPPSLRHLYQEAPQSNLIIGDVFSTRPFSISSNDHGDEDDNDNDMDYQPSPLSDALCYEEEDVKPFAHPVEMETGFGSVSESPGKTRKSAKKVPTPIKSKVATKVKKPKVTTKVKAPKGMTKAEKKKSVVQKPKQKKKSVLVKEEVEKENSDAAEEDEDEYFPPSVKKQAPGKKKRRRAPYIGPYCKKATADLRIKSLKTREKKPKKSKGTGKKGKKEATGTTSSTSDITPTATTTTTTNPDSNVDEFPVNLPEIVGEPRVLTYDQVAKKKKEEGYVTQRERRQMTFRNQYRKRQEQAPCPCLYCSEDFQTPEERVAHVRQHHCKNRKYVCEICGATFKNPNMLNYHQNKTAKKCIPFLDKTAITDPVTQQTCNICQKVFKSPHYVKTHMERMHKNKPESEAGEKKKPVERNFPCSVVLPETGQLCPYRAGNAVILKFHIQNVHAKEHEKVKCSECGIVVKNANYFKSHFERKHTERGRQIQERAQEKVKAKKRANTKAVHEKGFVCPYCGVDFITKPRYTIHLAKVHDDYGTRYKIVVCELCGKKFQGKYRHEKHMKSVHIDTRHFVCDECGLSYKSQSSLDTHKFRCHSEAGRQHYNAYNRANYRRKKLINEQKRRKAAMGAEMSDSGSVEVPDANNIASGSTSTRSALPPPASTMSIPTAVMGPQGNSLQQIVPPPPPVDFEGSIPANLSLNLFSHNMAFGF